MHMYSCGKGAAVGFSAIDCIDNRAAAGCGWAKHVKHLTSHRPSSLCSLQCEAAVKVAAQERLQRILCAVLGRKPAPQVHDLS